VYVTLVFVAVRNLFPCLNNRGTRLFLASAAPVVSDFTAAPSRWWARAHHNEDGSDFRPVVVKCSCTRRCRVSSDSQITIQCEFICWNDTRCSKIQRFGSADPYCQSDKCIIYNFFAHLPVNLSSIVTQGCAAPAWQRIGSTWSVCLLISVCRKTFPHARGQFTRPDVSNPLTVVNY
jgi:hypothetical protein